MDVTAIIVSKQYAVRRASGALRIETVFRAFVGASSATAVTIRRLDETFALSRKFAKTGTIETTNLKARDMLTYRSIHKQFLRELVLLLNVKKDSTREVSYLTVLRRVLCTEKGIPIANVQYTIVYLFHLEIKNYRIKVDRFLGTRNWDYSRGEYARHIRVRNFARSKEIERIMSRSMKQRSCEVDEPSSSMYIASRSFIAGEFSLNFKRCRANSNSCMLSLRIDTSDGFDPPCPPLFPRDINLSSRLSLSVFL